MMCKLSAIFTLFTILLVATQGQSVDPFAPPDGRNKDPFAASGGSGVDPFAIDPFAPQADEEDNHKTSTSDYVDLLPSDKKRAVVIVEGDNARGTGFIARLNNILFVVTNQHVIKNNPNPTFQTMNGDIVTTNGLYIAKGYDVAIFRISGDTSQLNYFEVEDDVFDSVKVDDSVLIPGNSMGDGTILQTRGTIIAIGPKLIEHNAPTFSGNSGSPVILEKNWKVIGVDTLSTSRDGLKWFNQFSKDQKGSQIKNDVRLFGYRIDNIKEWEGVRLKELERQHADILEIQKEAYSVLSAVHGSKYHYQNSPTVSTIIHRYYKRTAIASLAHSDVEYQKKVARSGLYNHLMSTKSRAKENKSKAYACMVSDYDEAIAVCDWIFDHVGKYYEAHLKEDPFEARQ
tara:strand:+ start:1867 stop:3066 length:1200 start_codon:yes stop_codon:yes gene_type:complete